MSGIFWGSHEGCQGPFRPSGWNRGLPLYRRSPQMEEEMECWSYHSTSEGQRPGGSETFHARGPRPQDREMTWGLFPRQLPGPKLRMQGRGKAVVPSDFPGASEHLLPSPPQPPGLSEWSQWSQKLQDLLRGGGRGRFPAGGSCPPRVPGSQALPGLPAPLSWGPKVAPPRFLPQGPSLPSKEGTKQSR